MAKKVSNFKTLWINDNPKNYTEIFAFNGKKFRMHFEHTNGTPCGFNYKCSLDIMVPDGTFHHIMDNLEMGVDWSNSYVCDPTTCKRENSKAIPAFHKYVEAVYAE